MQVADAVLQCIRHRDMMRCCSASTPTCTDTEARRSIFRDTWSPEFALRCGGPAFPRGAGHELEETRVGKGLLNVGRGAVSRTGCPVAPSGTCPRGQGRISAAFQWPGDVCWRLFARGTRRTQRAVCAFLLDFDDLCSLYCRLLASAPRSPHNKHGHRFHKRQRRVVCLSSGVCEDNGGARARTAVYSLFHASPYFVTRIAIHSFFPSFAFLILNRGPTTTQECTSRHRSGVRKWRWRWTPTAERWQRSRRPCRPRCRRWMSRRCAWRSAGVRWTTNACLRSKAAALSSCRRHRQRALPTLCARRVVTSMVKGSIVRCSPETCVSVVCTSMLVCIGGTITPLFTLQSAQSTRTTSKSARSCLIVGSTRMLELKVV